MLIRTDRADDKVRDHVRSLPGEQPYVHNYYTNDRFFRHDPAKGTVETIYGQPVLRVTEDFVVGLAVGLEKEVGGAANEIMYKCGEQWGRRDMAAFSERMRAEFECEFNKFGMGMMLETWWWPLTIEGWGTWRFDFTQGKQGLIFVDLFESAVAKSIGNVGKVVCHFYAGLFASVFTSLAKRELASIEVQCYSMGEDHCKFLVASNKRVNAAAFWRNEGASPKDILKKLKETV